MTLITQRNTRLARRFN